MNLSFFQYIFCIHITEDSLERKSVAIACRRFPGCHTWDNVAELLLQINRSFGLIGEKLISTVTDNGSNFVKAFKELGVTLYRYNEDENYNCIEYDDFDDDNSTIGLTEADGCSLLEENLEELPQHIRCVSHTLHLVATTTIITALNDNNRFKNIYDETISRCETLWKSMRSPKKREALIERFGFSLKRSVITRWNSFFDSLYQIYSLQDKIMQVDMLQKILDSRITPRLEDFRFIKEYLACVEPLAKAIDILQSENNCYYGYLLPTLISLRRKWSFLKEQNPPPQY